LAIASIYGVDILQDNVFQCRERLLNSFEACYVLIFDESLSSELKNSVSYILERNILWGDVLTMKTVCEKNENLIFSEWCAINGNMIKRRDYSLAHLLAHHPTDTPNLFSDLGESAFIPRPVKEYPLILYSKLHHHG
jgi:hypothetical protein